MKLKELLSNNQDAAMTYQAMVLGYRLYMWGLFAFQDRSDFDPSQTVVLSNIVQTTASERFRFHDLFKQLGHQDLKEFLKGKSKESLRDDKTRRSKLAAINKRLKRTDVPVFVHSLATRFKDNKFPLSGVLMIFGPAEAIRFIMRKQAFHHASNGGRPVMFTDDERAEKPEHKKIAVMPEPWYRNAGVNHGTLAAVLEPARKSDLLLVDNIDKLCNALPVSENRKGRIILANSVLRQYAANNPMAVMLGIPWCDSDFVKGKSTELPMSQRYGKLMREPHIICRIQEVDGKRNVVIGNDLVEMEEEA